MLEVAWLAVVMVEPALEWPGTWNFLISISIFVEEAILNVRSLENRR